MRRKIYQAAAVTLRRQLMIVCFALLSRPDIDIYRRHATPTFCCATELVASQPHALCFTALCFAIVYAQPTMPFTLRAILGGAIAGEQYFEMPWRCRRVIMPFTLFAISVSAP